MKHGTSYAYTNGCRCDVCREGSRVRVAIALEARKERLLIDPTLAPHGVRNTYVNWKCRCEPCTTANTTHFRLRRTAR
jgi:hypothetical protein